jgi:lactoylglutathione lyase
MAKIIHSMIRVLSPEKSIDFYAKAFGLVVANQFDFEDFSLIYLRNEENDVELELTHNHDQQEAYTHGDGYGHLAFVVDDLESEHKRFDELGYAPSKIVEFNREGSLMAKFFFLKDPDGYDIEVLQKWGRYQ